MNTLLRGYWSLAQIGIVLYGLVLNGYLLLRSQVGERWDTVAFANNFVPWWALGGLVLGTIGLFSRRRWLLVPLQAPILITFLAAYGDLLWPPQSAAEAQNGLTLTVATYNIYSEKSDPQQVVQVIKELDADIVGLQELGPKHARLIERDLAGEYPYQLLYPSPSLHGIGLLSRYPIVDDHVYLSYYKYIRHLRIVLNINDSPVIVYLTHPHSPRTSFPPTAYDDRMRNEQLAVLRDELKEETDPVLVLCDCNMSDQSDAYKALDRVLDDAFREAGWGMGFTFMPRRLLPMLRLDYIWHNVDFVARDAHPGSDSGSSDHRPMIAELMLQPQE